MKNKLMNKNFVLLWQGMAFSTIGDVLYSIAIGIWVFDRTGSTSLMGVMTAITYLVSMFGSPISGALIDRINRKKAIVFADAIRGVIMIAIGIIAFQDNLEVWMVLVVAFIAALCSIFFNPAVNTAVVQMVPEEALVQAQSVVEGTNSLIRMIGSAVSGFLVIVFKVPLMILINGISFLISAFTECFIHFAPHTKASRPLSVKSIISDMKDGLLFVKNKPGLTHLMIIAFILNLLGSGLGAVLYPFCLAKGLSVTQYGLFLGAESLASLLALLLLAVRPIKGSKRKIMYIAMSLTTLFSIALVSISGFWNLSILNFIVTALNVVFNALLNAMLILQITEEHRGKVFGLVSAYSAGGVAFSNSMYGFLGDIIGIVPTAIFFAICSIVPTFFFVTDKKIGVLLEDYRLDNEK